MRLTHTLAATLVLTESHVGHSIGGIPLHDTFKMDAEALIKLFCHML